MPSINFISASEVVTVRTYKRLAGRPDLAWANTYEVLSNLGGQDASDVVTMGNVIKEWERLFHLVDVEFDRVVISTWVPDGEPYKPDTFVSVDGGNVNGTRVVSGDPLALDVCLLARKQVTFGRNGRNLYRRCISENDVTAGAGKFVLSAGSQATLEGQMNPLVNGQSETGLAGLLAAEGWSPVMAADYGSGINVRSVLSIVPTGVVVKKTNNRWFDRERNTPPA